MFTSSVAVFWLFLPCLIYWQTNNPYARQVKKHKNTHIYNIALYLPFQQSSHVVKRCSSRSSVPAQAAGYESVLCLEREIEYFESVLGVQQVNKYLMTVSPLLSSRAQADDLLTFRHPVPDELLRAKPSVKGVEPSGIEKEGYLCSNLTQMTVNTTPPADWTFCSRGNGNYLRSQAARYSAGAAYRIVKYFKMLHILISLWRFHVFSF